MPKELPKETVLIYMPLTIQPLRSIHSVYAYYTQINSF